MGALLWLRNHYEINPSVPRIFVIERIEKVLQDCEPSVEAATAFREAYPIRRKNANGRPLSWRTCPSCMGRQTKIFNMNTGMLECQMCDHHYFNPGYIPDDPKQLVGRKVSVRLNIPGQQIARSEDDE